MPRGQYPRGPRGPYKPRVRKTKSHCVHGHAMTWENTYVRQDGYLECRACSAESVRRWRAKHDRKDSWR